ncbi:MAG: hypothetical protein QOJ53_1172 [Sphingomonadales bacterium]|jgi:uncharacterized membrane protein|nr:hypothetical protein [Sphingomonadales bacterium]
MKNAAFLFLLLAAGCATSQTPYSPVRDVAYQALGWNPMWLLAVGDDRIVLRQAGAGERAWPRVLPRTVDGVRIWQSGTGADRITIATRPGPCQSGSAGQAVYNYEHHVAVSVGDQGGLELRGCGGRMLERVERR